MDDTCTQLAAALLLWFSGISGTAAADADPALLPQLIPSVLKVQAANTDGSISIGSGVVIGRGLIATNCHVTRLATSIEVAQGAMHSDVESELSDVEHDLCLLYAPAAANYKAATVASDSPQTGQTVFAIGFAGGGSVRVSSGQIDAIYDYDGGKVIQTSAWFASGASGGGLFDEQGRLIGIISFMSRGPVVRHYCLPASWAARAAEHFDGGQPVTPLNGLPFWQEPEDRRPQFLQTANLKPTGG